MTERVKLFAAILERPEDESARLAYEQWLRQHDDPLGKFIEVQRAMSKINRWDADWTDLMARSRRLLLEHQEAWEQTIRPVMAPNYKLGGRLASGVFHRGLPAFASVTAETFIRSHKELFEIAPIQFLRIEACHGLIRDLLACSEIERIDRLELAGTVKNPIGTYDARAIADCEKLKNLSGFSLSQAAIGGEGIEALVSSPNLVKLRILDLTGNRLKDLEIDALANSLLLPRLSELFIGKNLLTSKSIERLTTSLWANKLKTLSFADIEGFKSAGVARLAASPQLRELQSLNIALCSCEAEGAKALAESEYLRQLVDLDLRGDEIGPKGATAIGRASWPELRALDLGMCALGTIGVNQIVSSPLFPKLSWLRLSGNDGGDGGLTTLCRSPMLGQLHVLDFGGAGVSDKGTECLCKLHSEIPLKHLGIKGSKLSGAGFVQLVESEALKNLVSLDVSNSKVSGDELAVAISKCPAASKIFDLRLSQVGMTNTGALALAQSPNLNSSVVLELLGNKYDSNARRSLIERFGCGVLLSPVAKI